VRVLIAPQEFKGSLSAAEAARAMAEGLRRALPGVELDLAPMADGGPGTVEALVAAGGGQRLTASVTDPLGRPVEAAWGLLEEGATAVIEMAAASGLVLLRSEERDARRTSTYGTGQLIAAALEASCRRLIIGLGGSATNDGGAGMAQALGARLSDEGGRDLPPGGAALARLARIDVSGLDGRLRNCQVLGATDVTNPLCGPHGASAIYGPQKGASPADVKELDAALAHYAAVIERDLGKRVAEVPGAGAAGGIGAGLIAFLDAELRPGAQLVAEVVGLEKRIAAADLVVTGEGRLDAQTAYGKTVATVARLARGQGRPVVALVGRVDDAREACSALGLEAALSIVPSAMGGLPEAEVMARASELLAAAAESLGHLLRLGGALPD
jgi:glycerate kinase